jgi:hypothetical protein
MSEPLRIANVNVFDSVEGRVGGPFDVTVGDGVIASVRPSGPGGRSRGPVLIGP